MSFFKNTFRKAYFETFFFSQNFIFKSGFQKRERNKRVAKYFTKKKRVAKYLKCPSF